MGIFNFFRSRQAQSSAAIAKERLQVMIAHERTDRGGPDYLPMLKQDIIDVIKKYISIEEDQVSVQLGSQENCDVLELNITLPEDDDAGRDSDSSRNRVATSAEIEESEPDEDAEGSVAATPAQRAHRRAVASNPASKKRGKQPRRRTSNPVS